jgi:DNA-binding CsgD family transcriptional regulator
MGDDLNEIIASLKELPVPAALTDLESGRVVATNDPMVELLGPPVQKPTGFAAIARIPEEEHAAALAGMKALADRAVDGFLVSRSFITASGNEVTMEVWGRRVEHKGKTYGAWILLPEKYAAGLDPSSVVLAMTDHDWVIQYMSADADLLGSKGSDLRGFPLLGLVHPSGAADFLEAARQVSEENLTVTFCSRVRIDGEGWVERQCLLTRMCDHKPPRLGFVITPRTTEGRGQLADELHHCALESRRTHTLATLPALSLLPNGSELSARQTEIVSQLLEGKSASDIARQVHLSPSTIRNHLAAIYRKFGVHSQAELLAVLLRETASMVQ